MDDNEARERMQANPFAPTSTPDYALRQAHAAEYTAYYLGEIARCLAAIADRSGDTAISSGKIASSAAGIAYMFANGALSTGAAATSA